MVLYKKYYFEAACINLKIVTKNVNCTRSFLTIYFFQDNSDVIAAYQDDNNNTVVKDW